jgi:CheY-like chemotaxis protein
MRVGPCVQRSGDLLRGATMRMPMPPSVLVVDDEDSIRDATRFVLEDESYTVYEAPDGKLALARLREHPEGMVVLLDLQMPGMDCVMLLRALVADEQMATRHAIVLVTAQHPRKPAPEVAVLFAQFDVHIVSKPFDIADLIVAVQAAARRLDGDPAGIRRP